MTNSLSIEAERVAEIARAQLAPYLESQGSDQQRIVQEQRWKEGERGERERTDKIEHERIAALGFGQSEEENLRLVGLEQLEHELDVQRGKCYCNYSCYYNHEGQELMLTNNFRSAIHQRAAPGPGTDRRRR